MKPTHDTEARRLANKALETERAKLLEERARIVARLRQLDAQQIASYIQPVSIPAVRAH